MSNNEKNSLKVLSDALSNSFIGNFPDVEITTHEKFDSVSVKWDRSNNAATNRKISYITFRALSDCDLPTWGVSGAFYTGYFFEGNSEVGPYIDGYFECNISLDDPEITIEEFRRMIAEFIKSDIESRIAELSTNIDELLGFVLKVDPSAYSDEMLNLFSQIVETGKSFENSDDE